MTAYSDRKKSELKAYRESRKTRQGRASYKPGSVAGGAARKPVARQSVSRKPVARAVSYGARRRAELAAYRGSKKTGLSRLVDELTNKIGSIGKIGPMGKKKER